MSFYKKASTNCEGLTIICVVPECGGELRGTTGTFTSPNYRNPSLHKLKCEWRIVVPLGRRVTLTISEMTFGFSQNCSSDFVAVSVNLNVWECILPRLANVAIHLPLKRIHIELVGIYNAEISGNDFSAMIYLWYRYNM